MKALTTFSFILDLVIITAFAPYGYQRPAPAVSGLFNTGLQSTEGNPADELSEERKANLFQFLLRDLEIEGVPLLGCDADQVHTFQAALWTTMGQLSDGDEEGKACLILEDIPMDALRAFVDDFLFFKSQERLMLQLPELQRINLSLVGKGVGPAIVIETTERTDEEKDSYHAMKTSTHIPDEAKWQGSMEKFVNRMLVGNNVCLDLVGDQADPIAYRLVGSNDVCDTMAAFWSCMSEILALPKEEIGSLVMCSAPVAAGAEASQAHQRFAAIAELMSRNLFLYRGEDLVDLWHMHPLYERDSVFPGDKPQHGHLPPTAWLRGMLSAVGNNQEAESLADDQLKLQNFQRRSPVPAVLMRRVSEIEATDMPQKGVTQIDVGDGNTEMASDVGVYTANLLTMIALGEESLQTDTTGEINSID